MLHKSVERIHLVNPAWYLAVMSNWSPTTSKTTNWSNYNRCPVDGTAACRATDSTGIKARSRQHPADAPAGQRMHGVKLLGQRLSARDFDRQVAEIKNPGRDPQRLYSALHARNCCSSMNPSRLRGSLASTPFVQLSYSPIVGQILAEIKLLSAPDGRGWLFQFSASKPRWWAAKG